MANNTFNFLNISKVDAAERTWLSERGVFLAEKIYVNHSGEWYAAKFGATYRIVSYSQLMSQGWTAQGIAGSLKGVREVIETLHNGHEAAKTAAGPWA